MQLPIKTNFSKTLRRFNSFKIKLTYNMKNNSLLSLHRYRLLPNVTYRYSALLSIFLIIFSITGSFQNKCELM